MLAGTGGAVMVMTVVETSASAVLAKTMRRGRVRDGNGRCIVVVCI